MDTEGDCPRGCHKYNKSVREIVQACSKHRVAALSLKDISVKQREKIKEYKETIENLRIGQHQHDEYVWKVSQENRDLEKEVNLLKKKLKEQIDNQNDSEEASEEENEETLSRREQLEEDVESGFQIVQSKVKEIEAINKDLKREKEEKTKLAELVIEFKKKKKSFCSLTK